jgi:hypothetical protein
MFFPNVRRSELRIPRMLSTLRPSQQPRQLALNITEPCLFAHTSILTGTLFRPPVQYFSTTTSLTTFNKPVAATVVANATAPIVASNDTATWPFINFVFPAPVALNAKTSYSLVVRLKTLGAVQLGLVSDATGIGGPARISLNARTRS